MVLVAVVIPPPQLKVAPPVVEVAARVSLVLVQVKTVGGLIPEFGAVMFWVTVTEAEVVQLLEGSVTVTAYGPGLVIRLVAVVIPPPQLKVAPPVVEDAVNVSLTTAQVKIEGGAMAALGGVTVRITVIEAEAVQPLVGSVTVTV